MTKYFTIVLEDIDGTRKSVRIAANHWRTAESAIQELAPGWLIISITEEK